VDDSVIGLSIEDAHRVALAADDVQQVRVFGNDPITSVASSYGVFLILIGVVVVLGLATHLAAR